MNKRKMQRLINRTARASSLFYEANKELCTYCLEVYGCEPADVDCDQVIDAVQGGAGASAGLSVQEFDAAMREAIEMCGGAPR